MSKKGRRVFARALGRGPLRPAQIGVGVFSAAFLLVGVLVFAFVASPIVQQELTSGRLLPWASADGRQAGLWWSSGDSAGSSDGALSSSGSKEGLDGGDASSGSPADAASSGADGQSGSGGSASFPSVTSPDVDAGSSDGGQSGNGSSGSSGSSGSGSATSDSGSSSSSGDVAQNSTPSGPSESEEQAALQFLRSMYDGLASHQQRISEDYANFPSLGLTPSHDERYGYFTEAVNSRDQVDVALVQMEDYRLPSGSRYATSYQNIKQLYSDLSSAASILARAWSINCAYDDPSAYVDAWMSPIYDYSSGGKLTFFSDYESRYPGARP